MTDNIQTNFRAGDMIGASKVTATPATIAKLVAPKVPVGPAVTQPVVETDAVVEDVEVDEEVA
jgi:hypothetical protein